MAQDQSTLLTRVRRLVVALVAFAAVAVEYDGVPWAYFSYFTVMTNFAIGVWFLGAAWKGGAWERASRTRLALTVYGLVTVSVYWVLLSPTHHPEGAQFVANLMLHAVVPAAMALEDLWFPWPKSAPSAPWWVLSFPVAYCVVGITRGLVTGWYPYYFLDPVQMQGWAHLSLFCGFLLVVFLGLAYGWRALVHRRTAAT